jgi:quinol monooxygenase YgiN
VTSYYVYYKVEEARREALRAQVEELFARVREQTGVQGRWMRRRDEPSTFMEVYENVPDAAAFEAVLARESSTLGLERHTERFVCA